MRNRDPRNKEEMVYQVFDRISDQYDAANDRISLGFQRKWKKELIRSLKKELPRGGKLLDVCCGTGDIAALAAKERADIQADGLDFSPAMLKIAKQKTKGLGNVSWTCGNAHFLPWPEDYFDAVSISFGLRNTKDFEAALREMKRVLKPGGFLYCLDSFVPEQKGVLPFYRLYFRGIMPLIGGGFRFRKEYQWLWKSTEEFLREHELAHLLQRIGMKKVGRKRFLFGASVLFRAEK